MMKLIFLSWLYFNIGCVLAILIFYGFGSYSLSIAMIRIYEVIFWTGGFLIAIYVNRKEIGLK